MRRGALQQEPWLPDALRRFDECARSDTAGVRAFTMLGAQFNAPWTTLLAATRLEAMLRILRPIRSERPPEPLLRRHANVKSPRHITSDDGSPTIGGASIA
jgi:hypothetical protein